MTWKVVQSHYWAETILQALAQIKHYFLQIAEASFAS